MATEASQPLKMSLVAGADLSGNQYRFIALNTSGKAVAYTGSEKIIGVLQNKPTANQSAEVVVAGITKMICSAAVTAADGVGPAGGDGRATTDNTGTALGRALSTTANAGEYLSVLIVVGAGL